MLSRGLQPGVPGRDFDYTHPVDDYPVMVRAVVLQPAAFFAALPRRGGYVGPLVFALIGAGISAILGGILGIVAGQSVGGFVTSVVGGLIVQAIGLFVVAAIAQLAVMLIVGATNSGFEATFRVVSYASATRLVSWIPVIGPLAMLYGIYLSIVGMREMHQTTMGKAALVVLVPAVVFVVLAFFAMLVGAIASLSFVR